MSGALLAGIALLLLSILNQPSNDDSVNDLNEDDRRQEKPPIALRGGFIGKLNRVDFKS
jgi:hypothetical protein